MATTVDLSGGWTARLFPCVLLLCLVGCASPNGSVLVDPLKQRLLAREDVALQNLLFARMPAYGAAGSSGAYSYLDAPYDGPAVEPPLPDLNLLPEDMPPWDDVPSESGGAEIAPAQTASEPIPPAQP
jgi:hypothetical protein